MIDVPETRYTRAPDGAYIAFQVFGSGPIDVLLMPGFFTNLDENWRIAEIADTHRRIAGFARVIAMDRRGVGLSDRLSPGHALETHVDDLVAVLDATSARDVCLVTSESGSPLLDSAGTVFFGRSNLHCGKNAQLIERKLDGSETLLYTFPKGQDFSFSGAVDNVDGTTDVYFDQGSCSGADFGDIWRLPGI